MTVPGDVSATKLAGDYLADLTQVALRYLPKGDRLKFIGRTKALIERRCGPLAEADPGRVAALLSRSASRPVSPSSGGPVSRSGCRSTQGGKRRC